MAAKGYTTSALVAAFLGVAFTPAQGTHCAMLIEQAEGYIDRRCRRAWLVGAQVEEAHFTLTRQLFLNFPPLDPEAAVTVTGRSGLGESEATLVAGADYEVRDPVAGELWLVAPRDYDRVRVSYTPLTTVPPELQAAATELVASWMQPALRPDSYGLDSYQLPDLAVKFARSHVQTDEPPGVRAILDLLTFPVMA